MPVTLEELTRRTIREILDTMPPEELLERIPVEKRLEGVSAAERLKGLSTEDFLAGLTPEQRAALAERLRDTGSQGSPE